MKSEDNTCFTIDDTNSNTGELFTVIGMSLLDGESFVEEVHALTPNEAWLKGVDQHLNQFKNENEPHEIPDWLDWECICIIRGSPEFAQLDVSDERIRLFP